MHETGSMSKYLNNGKKVDIAVSFIFSGYFRNMLPSMLPKTTKKRLPEYVCEVCSYSSNKLSNYKRHLQSIKHKCYHDVTKTTTKNEPEKTAQKDGVIMQSSKNKINEKVHYEKNDYKTSQNELENEPYYCHYCNYQSENISNYKRHLKTKKHKQEIAKHNGQSVQERAKTPPIKEQDNTNFQCVCGSIYRNRQSLYRHRKKCEVFKENSRNITDLEQLALTNIQQNKKQTQDEKDNSSVSSVVNNMKEIMMEVVKQNQDLQSALNTQLEDNKKMNEKLVELAQQPKTVINNTQNNFNTLNYLNSEYKDAMTIDDFINSLQVTIEDLKAVREMGFVNGIGAKIVKELQDIPENLRPVHFSKRRIKEYFTKQCEGWMREDRDKQELTNMVKNASMKHISFLMKNRKEHPEEYTNDDDYKQYQKTLFNSYKGLHNDKESNVLRNKIFKQLENLTISNIDEE